MQLSTRGRYAVMAMVHLACRQMHCARPVTLAEIASTEGLSLAYLEQLFGPLRRAQLVVSARGPGGGYRLARTACDISIADIVCAVEEPLAVTRCTAEVPGCIGRPEGLAEKCRTHDLWHELGQHIHMFLCGVSLAHVVDGQVAGRACRAAPAGDAAVEPAAADIEAP
jgi:Rrf2 family iron-sulfur cluster assembly transcriptional regulator